MKWVGKCEMCGLGKTIDHWSSLANSADRVGSTSYDMSEYDRGEAKVFDD